MQINRIVRALTIDRDLRALLVADIPRVAIQSRQQQIAAPRKPMPPPALPSERQANVDKLRAAVGVESASWLRCLSSWLAAVLFSVMPHVSAGAPVAIEFTGTVSYAKPNPYRSSLEIHSGDTLSGTYIFDSLEAPRDNSYIPIGSYALWYDLASFVIDVGNLHFSLGRTQPGEWQESNIMVVDDCLCGTLVGDRYNVTADRYGLYDFKFDLDDPTGTALQDTSLPLLPPDLAAYTSATWELYSVAEDWDRYGWMELVASGSINSIAAVPLPASIWLCLGGVFWIFAYLRRPSAMGDVPRFPNGVG